MTQNYKMVLEYDGSRYNGWQKQNNTSNTIQQKIEKILSDVSKSDVEVFGSGRTDAGTHAWGQTANFHMHWQGTTEQLFKNINMLLPEDIALLSLQKVDKRFHARFHAVGKKYIYRIWNSEISPVFQRKYVFVNENTLDIEQMKKAACLLLGEHDFKNFCSNKKMKKSTIRHLYSIDIVKKGNEIQIIYIGNGFLYNMVRILTGTLIEVGEKKRTVQSVLDIFSAENRQYAGFTAPAKGLVLAEVYYDTVPVSNILK
ncbi:tRNA pseudouridine(38-40) synthase TruA [Lachnospiraceae bacterium 46-61]